MFLALAFILGVLPSFVWLLYYLQSDKHPEPKSMILEVFILGMFSGGTAIGFQYLMTYVSSANDFLKSLVVAFPIIMIIGWAFIEEYVKFLSAKIRIIHDAAFDEPADAMIYLITAGLGFAAIENILFVMPHILTGIDYTINFLFLRFITATLLHTLASGIIGFFFALAIIFHMRIILILGVMLGVSLHAFYNYSIMITDGGYFLIAILLFGIIFIRVAFFQLKDKAFS